MSDTVKVEDEIEEFNEDVFEAMLHGTFEEDTGVEDDADNAEDLDNEYQEDTDQEEESDEEDYSDEASDGELDENSDSEEDDEEEDTLVEADDSDDEDDSADDEEEDADEADKSEEEDIDEESEDNTDTEDQSDGEGSDTDEVDYKSFYDAVVNTEFVVNGKKVKGFADPKKIIQSQQMAGGFSEKMASFKQYRPFNAALKERGMLEDQAKFDLAMNLIDGDKEAIKAHLQSLNIDPIDLDMDKIDYSRKSTLASPESLVIEDTMERARASGIEDKVREVVGKQWDAESFQEFTSNDAVRNDLLNHIETGVYDTVQDKMAELSRLDYNGAYGSLSTVNKYRAAVKELQAEQAAKPVAPVTTPAKAAPAAKQSSVKAEKAKIEAARKDAEYKNKAAAREAKLTQQRKRASSMSKKTTKPKAKPVFDPMKIEGTELDDLMNQLISGGRA